MGKIGTSKVMTMPVLADLGAQASIISPEWAQRLNLVPVKLEEPIKATFANGTTQWIESYVRTEVEIGKTYKATVPLLVCPSYLGGAVVRYNQGRN